MGNYRFRLSDMMPNAWFYKLKEIGKTKNHNNIPVKKKQSIPPPPPPAQPPQPPKAKQNHRHRQAHHHPYSSYPRKSYHFTRELIQTDHQRFHTSTDTHFTEPPRKSSKRRLLRKRAPVKHSSPKLVSAACSCRAATTLYAKSSDSLPDYSASSSDSSRDESSDLCEDDSFPPEFRSDRVLVTDQDHSFNSCGCKVVSDGNLDDDIIIDVDKKSIGAAKFDKLDILDLDLPPIITKHSSKFHEEDDDKHSKKKEITKETTKEVKNTIKKAHHQQGSKEYKNNSNNNSVKRHYSLNSPGLRLRVNSPKIAASRRIQGGRKSVSSSNSSSSSRRSLSDSLAIVKSSFDPQRDFRESMVEMIVENNIRASKDLEDLLACYLSLNSDEYHDLIIKVFKQIWFDLTETPPSK